MLWVSCGADDAGDRLIAALLALTGRYRASCKRMVPLFWIPCSLLVNRKQSFHIPKNMHGADLVILERQVWIRVLVWRVGLFVYNPRNYD